MSKKYQINEVQLSPDEMKAIMGGVIAQQGTRYQCAEGSWVIYYCAWSSQPPHPVCGHDYCNPIGACTPVTFNGINCQ